MSTRPSSAAVATAPRPPLDEATEILACRTTGDEVGEFLRERVPGLIVGALAAALPADVAPARCAVTRTKLKPGRRLTVSALLDGLGPAPRPVAAVWGSPPHQFADASADPEVRAEVRRPFTSLRVTPAGGSGGGPFLLVAPLDPAFPGLAALHDAEHLAGVLRSQGIEAVPDELALTTLRYRPGQRHVLRVDLARSGRSIFVKCYRDDTGAAAARAWTRVAAAVSSWGGPAAPVRPLGYVEAERLMLWEGSAGPTLTDVADRSVGHVRTAGALLRAIHDSPVDPTEQDRASDPEREGAATLRSCEHVMALLPARTASLTSSVTQATRGIAEGPGESGHLLHGDYKCDNILVEDDRLRLLDLDRVTLGDPALDLGKMTADLRWSAATNDTAAEPLLDAFLDGYGECPPHRLRRAAGYDDIFMVRSVGRRIPLHEPGWSARVERMLAATSRTRVDR
jgi:hypothetical protein